MASLSSFFIFYLPFLGKLKNSRDSQCRCGDPERKEAEEIAGSGFKKQQIEDGTQQADEDGAYQKFLLGSEG